MTSIFIRHTRLTAAALLVMGLCWSCKKSSLLDEKPSTRLVIPSTLQDFQALLDLSSEMNATPSIGEVNADNYYLDLADYNGLSLSNVERNVYLWKPDVFEASVTCPSWNLPYKQVFNANVVLEGLEKLTVTATNQTEVNTIKGFALFYRAYAFFNIAQVFAPMYDSATAASDLGIPLRLSSDISEKSVRSSVKETYNRIFADLAAAEPLLPAGVPPVYRNRPSKPAVQALLARIYLSMRAYTKAATAANSSLQQYSTLVDYTTLSQTGSLPFNRYNDEVMYQSNFETGSRIFYGVIGVGNLDSNLYKSYSANDLRKVIYFRLANNIPRFKGSYAGSTFPFSGLAVDEQYLIRAECYARAGNAAEAMNDLNTMLRKRFSGTYVPLTASSPADALDKVLAERRKEMPARGQRLSDLRRLNKEGYNIVPKRVLDNQTYTLAASSPMYVLPIPADVIALTGMPQNPR